jgi:hypothetical protein
MEEEKTFENSRNDNIIKANALWKSFFLMKYYDWMEL